MTSCSICGNSEGNRLFVVKEMMFGLKEEFEYLECSECGCLQLLDIPENMVKYYPSDYYSMHFKNDFIIKRFLKKLRGIYGVTSKGLIGRLLSILYDVPESAKWVSELDLSFKSNILDIGSGIGNQLIEYQNFGFKNLTGIDPFIDSDISYSDTFNIYKKNIEQLDDTYDFIMMNHALEHIDDQHLVLKKIKDLMTSQSILMIRIPVTGTYAWENYNTDWFQIDAPRHFFIHTVKSFEILAKDTGFSIKNITFDSNENQFIISEMYKHGIPLSEIGKYYVSKKEKANFQKKAKKLNSAMNGDQACFYLKLDAID